MSKLSIAAKDLANAVKALKRIINKKDKLPSMQAIKFSQPGEFVCLSATNLDHLIEIDVEGAKLEGEFGVHVDDLDVIGDDADGNVTITKETISIGDFVAPVRAFEGNMLPKRVKYELGTAFNMPIETMANALKATKDTTERAGIRFAIHGVHVGKDRLGNSDHIVFASTDMATMKVIKTSATCRHDFGFTIPLSVVKAILPLMKDKGTVVGYASAEINGNVMVHLSFGDYVVIIKAHPGHTFPDYTRVVVQGETNLDFNQKKLEEAIKGSPQHMIFDNGNVAYAIRSNDHHEVSGVYTDSEEIGRFGFQAGNFKKVLSGQKVLSCKGRLAYSDAPMRLDIETNAKGIEKATAVLMPIRV